MAIGHDDCADIEADGAREIPSSPTAVAMVRGLIYLAKNPINPHIPRTISTAPAHIRLPEI